MGISPGLAGRAAVVALLLILAACTDSDTDTAAEGEVSSTANQGAADDPSASPTTSEPSQEATAIEIATAFMEARDQRDIDTTLALLSADALVNDFARLPRAPDEYRGLFEWWEIFDWRWTLEECQELVAGPPIRVSCDFLVENEWSRAQGSDPVQGQLELLVDGGHIVEVNRDSPAWSEVFRRWLSWLEQFHMEQIPVLYRLDDNGRIAGGPATTPEALDLFRDYLPEYIEWETANEDG